MKRVLLGGVVSGLLALSLSITAVAAKPEGKEKPGKSAKSDRSEAMQVEESSSLLGALTAAEQDELARLILEKEYGFTKESQPRGAAKELPPGLKKKLARGGSLPPGWQTKLQRGEVIGRETYDAAERLPDEILRRVTGRNDAV